MADAMRFNGADGGEACADETVISECGVLES